MLIENELKKFKKFDASYKIKWHESCNCECKLNSSACNNKPRWNKDKCRCECKELANKLEFDKGFIWNPSNCNCECDKSCNISENSDYTNCKCIKKAACSLLDKCDENINKTEVIHHETLSINESNKSTNIDLKILILANHMLSYLFYF